MRLAKWMVIALLAGLSGRAPAAVPGAKVEVEWNGAWYPAEVLRTDGNQCLIRYDGYDSSWDEWVGPERMRPVVTAESAPPPEEKPMTAPADTVTTPTVAPMTLRKGGMIWAGIDPDGTIRVGGSIVGKFENDGGVRKAGSLVGAVEPDGTIRRSGSIIGRIEQNGVLRRGGSMIGNVESGGTIRLNGSIWGDAGPCGEYRAKRAVTALLVFFNGDFGF